MNTAQLASNDRRNPFTPHHAASGRPADAEASEPTTGQVARPATSLRIAVVGAGAVGSSFAFQLARAGHDVTLVARGKRLAQLQEDRAVLTSAGQRAPVDAREVLDPTVRFDLVLVAVLASQVDPLLPVLGASAARTVMFMFNHFGPLDRLRDAVGAARFAFGFPAVLARLEDGKLTSQFYGSGITTTVTDPGWARRFTEAGVRSVVHHDMEAWLNAHVAFMVPLMIAAAIAHERGGGLPWRRARELARALDEGFRLVRELGHAITPAPIGVLSRMPLVTMALFLWAMSRVESIRNIGASGTGEARALIDAMTAVAPSKTPALLAIRP